MHESLAHACLQHFLFFFGQLPDFRPQTAPSTPATRDSVPGNEAMQVDPGAQENDDRRARAEQEFVRLKADLARSVNCSICIMGFAKQSKRDEARKRTLRKEVVHHARHFCKRQETSKRASKKDVPDQ